MLTLITDRRAGEPDLLAAIRHGKLEIKALDCSTVMEVDAPDEGWTHEKLTDTVEEVDVLLQSGVEAYLNGDWIGSTEV